MKIQIVLTVAIVLFCVASLSAQTWTWVSGDSTSRHEGVYGVKGVPTATNKPGMRGGSVSWTDQEGNIYLFGGVGDPGLSSYLNDVWKYEMSSGNWVWLAGADTADQTGDYGLKGAEHSDNHPGARDGATSWQDSNGNAFIFGGGGVVNGIGVLFSDLWKYNMATDNWTWTAGLQTTDGSGNYGDSGVSSPANVPGARVGAVSWSTADGQLYLFGGYGFGTQEGVYGHLNDLWKYDIGTGEWTWISGSTVVLQIGTYGVQGIEAPDNAPGARVDAVSWIGADGFLYLFGGHGYDELQGPANLNDMWRYNPSTGMWSWVSGASTGSDSGHYGAKGITKPENLPPARYNPLAWIDALGTLYIFGGRGHSELNDLWKYDPATGLWTWISGSNLCCQDGIYGTKGIGSSGNVPGARHKAISWTTPDGSFYLFGGDGYAGHGNTEYLNDLWKLDISTVDAYTVPGSLTDFALHQNYPNPINPLTTISYTVPFESRVMVRVYDVFGRAVATLVDKRQQAGYHSVNFSGARLPAGMYFYTLESENVVLKRRMVLLK